MVAGRHVPGTQQMSTVISDAALAGACGFGALLTQTDSPLGALGFATIGVAALLGVARFYGLRKAVAYHDLASFASTTTGMVLLGMGFMIPPNGFPDFRIAAGIAAAAGLATYFLSREKPKFEKGLKMAMALGFLGSAVFKCFLGQIWIGVAGAAIFAGAGLIGTNGKIQGFEKVDIFHYGLAVGVVLLAYALTQVW